MDPLTPHPPHISDGPGKTDTLTYIGEEQVEDDTGEAEWLKRAQDAYRFSTTYVDNNYRKKWDDSIRAFNSEHPTDSKYVQPGYDKRSKLYRPKARSVIRKNEAANAAAMFSNMDVVSIEALNGGSKEQVIAGELMQQVLNYRLDKSIPWFQTVQGAFQDAQVMGVVCSHQYWDYKFEDDGFGGQKVTVDKPCVTLFPAENLRIDPGASWVDPIGTSPYLIHIIPMYVADVKERMRVPDKRGKTWRVLSDGLLRNATRTYDSTTITRNQNREDPYDSSRKAISDYETVWVQRHIHRKDGTDWEFYTLSDLALLSDPEPLKNTVFHGERPYVMGCCVIETHKVMPNGVPQLAKGLIDESNEVANQRMDNVKLVLNKRWGVKRGRNVDVASLVRNVPGGVTLADDPATDITEYNWPDVTGSSYQEQERIDADLNELVGNFSPSSLPNRRAGETVRGMVMLSQPASALTEYLIRTFVETWVEPVLRQLVKLEQNYETDLTVLAIAGQKAQLWQKYGISQVTDQMLNQELTLKVNVGMGATDPLTKLQKFMQGVMGGVQIAASAQATGLDMGEVWKEIFGHIGYQDGRRFFGDQDPQKVMLQQQMQQMGQVIQQLQGQLAGKQQDNQTKLAITDKNNMTKVVVEDMRHTHDKNMLVGQTIAGRMAATHDASLPMNGNAAPA